MIKVSSQVCVTGGSMQLEVGKGTDVCGLLASESDAHVLDNSWDDCEEKVSQARTIQKAWRHYKEKNSLEQNANQLNISEDSDKGLKDACPPLSPSEADLSEADSGNQAMSISSPEECNRTIHDSDDSNTDYTVQENSVRMNRESKTETPSDNIVERYKDDVGHEEEEEEDYMDDDEDAEDDDDDEDEDDYDDDSDSALIPSDGLKLSESPSRSRDGYHQLGNFCSNGRFDDGRIDLDISEKMDELAKHVRKRNYLTIAQEFATYKKAHPEALPFNVHKMCQQRLIFDRRELKDSHISTVAGPPDQDGLSDDTLVAGNTRSDAHYEDYPGLRGSEQYGITPQTDVPDILKLDHPRFRNEPYAKERRQQKTSEGKIDSVIFRSMAPRNYYKINTDTSNHYRARDDIQNTSTMKDTPHVSTVYDQGPPANMASCFREGKNVSRQNKTFYREASVQPPANMMPRQNYDRSYEHSNRAGSSSSNVDGLSASAQGSCDKKLESRSSSGTKGPISKETKVSTPEDLGGFDVYNIETAMPTIDWAAMEEHLAKSAKEQLQWKRRNEREEIRRRLAMGSDSDDYYGGERMARKPSLQSRLQSGMNLQICFMNEGAKETETVSGDSNRECGNQKSLSSNDINNSDNTQCSDLKNDVTKISLPIPAVVESSANSPPKTEQEEQDVDFVTRQAMLQAEARLALAQAKEMAHMQMEVEKQRKKKSPIAEMVRTVRRCSLVGIAFPGGRRRTSRQVLLDMNVAQLQVIVNDLHTQIENLNEELVKLLLERDDLHMEQDSKLVDIEDLTRYLGAKDQALKDQSQQNSPLPQVPPGRTRKHPLPLLKMKLKK